MKKNILITTYFFFPTNSPRAFRITALAKKFAEKGHNVTVLTADIGYDYTHLEKDLDITIITVKTGYVLNRATNTVMNTPVNNHKSSKAGLFRTIKKAIRKTMLYLIPDAHIFEYSIRLKNKLKKLELNGYDVIISNSHPFSVHIGTAMAMKSYNNISIAESGDPHYFNYNKLAFYQKNIEKWVLSQFTYISIPLDKALDDYRHLGVSSKVSVIPHGFDFSNVKLFELKSQNDEIVKFAFAGRLYKNLRDPSHFLDYLVKKANEINFMFTIYTDFNNRETMDLLLPYKKKLGEKLIINPLVPREECIYLLSSNDFLINISNVSENQSPSKLIDYTLTKKPIISISHHFLEKEEFESFCKKDYSNYLPQDISQFNIDVIYDKFETLFKKDK